jgi:hypothetical protein
MRHALGRPRALFSALSLLSLLAVATLEARPARAQTALLSSPAPPWLQPRLPDPQVARAPLFGGEPSSAGSLSPWVVSSPLRLSLQSTIFPVAPLFPNCPSTEFGPGYAVPGIAMQRYAFLPLAPRLVLHGFSSAGCPIDGGVGGGVTYETVLRPNLSLVAGGGVYGVPARSLLPARTQAEARVDLIQRLDTGRSIGVGLSVRRGTPTVSIGGAW